VLDRIVRFVSAQGSKPRSIITRLWALARGSTLFLVVAPVLLILVARPVARAIALEVPRGVEVAVGGVAVLGGLALMLWAVVTFWNVGKGTPVPVVAPQRLVVSGPFRYCRNPIKLGACTAYLGLGALAVSLTAGVVMFAFALALGTAYHKLVEEPELRLRFGELYEEYWRTTPFIVPSFRRRKPG
jgi:protein-S-isoprenylcysteine O-methyltransferase Ste14